MTSTVYLPSRFPSPTPALTLAQAHPVRIYAISSVSIDPVGPSLGPFSWVGVLPSTLFLDDARGPAARCKEVLPEHKTADVEILLHESVYTSYVGLRLRPLDRVPSVDRHAQRPRYIHSISWTSNPSEGLLVLRRDSRTTKGPALSTSAKAGRPGLPPRRPPRGSPSTIIATSLIVARTIARLVARSSTSIMSQIGELESAVDS